MADQIPDSAKLLPCPFCGGPGHLQHSTFEIDSGWHVVCHGQKDCPLYCSEPYQVHGDEADAATRWNTRAAPPAMDRKAAREVLAQAAERAGCVAMPKAIRAGEKTILNAEIALDALSTLSADGIRQGEVERLASEAVAKALYDSWSDQPGWVPWVERGNSDMQERARREVML